MVAKITIPKSIQAALNYNEKKVQKEQAVCLHAENYLKDLPEMNFYQKLERFQRLNALNERATTKTIHVSLNFAATEILPDDKLVGIATGYMERIGFGAQPFLVYKHSDAGHPHIHIVSTTIKDNGKRISTHNLGRNQSEKARKEIEQLFGLVKAENGKKNIVQVQPVDIEKAIYGKQETKKSIAAIVTLVYEQYKYTSLPEFNAALKQFNVIADRGKEDGRIYRNNGLVYRILDGNGTKTGVPIKASLINCKPTLESLKKKFASNVTSKENLRQQTRYLVNGVLVEQPGSLSEFIKALSFQKVSVVLRRNPDGRLYGITFVDHKNKSVFNGSDLSKNLSIGALENIFNRTVTKEPAPAIVKEDSKPAVEYTKSQLKQSTKTIDAEKKEESILGALMDAKEQFNSTPFGLIKKKRKRKPKNTNQ